MHRATIHIGLILVCAGGCAHVHAPSSNATSDATVATPTQTTVAVPADVQPAAAPEGAATPATQPPVPPSEPRPEAATAKAKARGPKTSPKPPAAAASATQRSKPAAGEPTAGTAATTGTAATATATATAAAGPAATGATPARAADNAPEQSTLDLATLEQRLRETHAIGVMTKLSLKNQVDDLLDQFRSFHRGEGKVSLPELRQRYNLLLLKVLSLLQDGDGQLAAMISSSREAIWGILADPEKFAKI